MERQLRTFFLLAIAAVACRGIIGGPSRETTARGDIDDPRLSRIVESMHKAFLGLNNDIGGLSLDEQERVSALEKAVAADLRATPEKLDHPDAIKAEVLTKYRAAITPVHQKKYDELMAGVKRRRDELVTADHLKQLGVAILLYSRDHNDNMPPDLASLLSKSLGPGTFLAGGATTHPSADPAEQDDKHLAKWVGENAQFIYLGAGRKFSQLPPSFVVLYLKPAAAPGGTSLLLDDGTVVKLAPEQSAPVVAELQAGHNPPASLKK